MGTPYDVGVSINCPFDTRYRKLFHAIVFAISDCGFTPRCALEVEDGGEERIRKIKRIIRESRYGIHDISRVEVDPKSRLPRFNMPLELGLFLGAQEYGIAEQNRSGRSSWTRSPTVIRSSAPTSRDRTFVRTAISP